ncbi:MAG: hypothetical protein RLZZ112_772 [Verrucomicrobiota bacterium]|jgi:endonuclease/exonuclease/phosphatase family metal-dependent hydrolase
MAHVLSWKSLLILQALLAVGWCEETNLPTTNTPPEPKRFWVMAYNVENLMDVDRVAPYDDYTEIPDDPNSYSPTKLLRKLQTICRVLKAAPGGIGPDVVILNELEVDQTPESSVADLKEFLKKHEATTYEKMLTTELNDELRGLPVEAWLLKALEDEGLRGYSILVGEVDPNAGQHGEAIKVGLLTRFPVLEKKTHFTNQARGILEAKLDVEGNPVLVFGNHWKSGAGNPAMENVRLGNAKVLRDRLNQVLQENPRTDLILGGDFNSQYNQAQRYPFMPKTGLQDVLGSQGDPAIFTKMDGPDLYNLWFEVPPENRISDEYSGEWGTLMQLLVSRGMGDGQGVDLVPGTLTQLRIPDLNIQGPLELPWRWTNYGPGWGASDHFPVMAQFQVSDGSPPSFGSRTWSPVPPREVLKVGFDRIDRSKLRNAAVLKDTSTEDFAKAMGEIFVVEATFSKIRPLEVEIDGKSYSLHSFDKDLKKALGNEPRGKRMKFLGELGMHKGKPQFVVHDPSWIK